MDFRDFDFDDFLEALSSGNVFLVSSSNSKDSKCRCGRCPKPPPEPTIPDVASLIDEVLSNAGIRRPVATPMNYPRNTVTIFDGPFTGFFGILFELESSPCCCCVLVQTMHGVVKVSKRNCTIHP